MNGHFSFISGIVKNCERYFNKKVEVVDFPVKNLKDDAVIIERLPISYDDTLEPLMVDSLREMHSSDERYVCDTLPTSYELAWKRRTEWEFNRIFIPHVKYDSYCVSVIDELLTECGIDYDLQEVIKTKKVKGMKLGRFLRKQFKKLYPNNKNVERAVNIFLPRLLDYEERGWIVISNYPIDIIFPNNGNFASCLSPNGEYVSGALAYYNSENYFLVYLTETDECNPYYYTFEYTWRAYFAYSNDEQWIGILRYYPKEPANQREVLNFLCWALIGESPQDPHFNSDSLLRVSKEYAGHEVCSAKYTYFDGFRTVSHMPDTQFQYLVPINPPICVYCGDDFIATDRLVCMGCGDYGFYCYECGEAFAGEPEGWRYDGEPLCSSCLYDHYFYCEDCETHYPLEEKVSVILDNGRSKEVCSDCAGGYHFCEDCGNYVESGNDVFKEGDYETVIVCNDCLSNYNWCKHCGEYFSDKLFVFDYDLCRVCYKELEEENEEVCNG